MILAFIVVADFLFQVIFIIVFHGENGPESTQPCVKWHEETFFWHKNFFFVCGRREPFLLIQCFYDLQSLAPRVFASTLHNQTHQEKSV